MGGGGVNKVLKIKQAMYTEDYIVSRQLYSAKKKDHVFSYLHGSHKSRTNGEKKRYDASLGKTAKNNGIHRVQSYKSNIQSSRVLS